MAKSNLDRIESLLFQIGIRLGDFQTCLNNLSHWRRSAELAAMVAAMREQLRQKQLLLKAGGDFAVEELFEDVSFLHQLVAGVPPNSRLTFEGRERDALPLLQQLLGSVQNMLNGVQYGLKRMSADQLRDTIPKQKVAAYQFAFDGDKLIISPQRPDVTDPDHAIAAASLKALVEQGERLVRELSQSNCPPRLIEAFSALQKKLETHENVVEIGMLNKSCMSLANASADELASTLIEWLKAHLVGVYEFLAQHPDWRRFVENALSNNLRPDQVQDLSNAARAVANVAAEYDNVDAAVPSAFEGIALLADEIKEPDGRVALGLSRTLENIISLAARCLLGMKNDLQSEARKMLARSILLAISGVAVATLALVPGAEWVPSAISEGLKVIVN